MSRTAQDMNLARRHRRERRFRRYGQAAVGVALLMLAWLLLTIFRLGLPAFTTLHVEPADLPEAQALQLVEPGTDRLSAEAEESYLVFKRADPNMHYVGLTFAEARLKSWADDGGLERRLDVGLLMRTDSPAPSRAGLRTALLGSVLMLFVAAGLCIPVGLISAIYLHEFAPRTGWGGKLARGLDVLINNLAAVPAIVFGLLGLAVFIGGLGLARSAVLTGGLVLALRVFPTVIIAGRGALSSVPDSMVDGALSLGASHMQAVFGHKLPLAAPGMITGAILALAQAAGEAAPLLLIGMVAYFTQAPSGLADPATALPVQIFMWAEGGDPVWSERAAAAILVLLAGLLLINGLAVALRARLTRRRRV